MQNSINEYNTSPTIDYYLPLYYHSIIVNIKNIEEQLDSESRRFLHYLPAQTIYSCFLNRTFIYHSNDNF